MQISVGSIEDLRNGSGRWMVVDIGFSANERSCGVWTPKDELQVVEFGELVKMVIDEAEDANPISLNLLLEAPLSIAFQENGNPSRRLCDRKGEQYRDWYVNAGATTLIAADHLLREVQYRPSQAEVRLFEGFVSFKKANDGGKSPSAKRAAHKQDVRSLRAVLSNPREACFHPPAPNRAAACGESPACIFDLQQLQQPGQRVQSAFAILSKKLVPPVIRINQEA